jgi:hypothetical protein
MTAPSRSMFAFCSYHAADNLSHQIWRRRTLRDKRFISYIPVLTGFTLASSQTLRFFYATFNLSHANSTEFWASYFDLIIEYLYTTIYAWYKLMETIWNSLDEFLTGDHYWVALHGHGPDACYLTARGPLIIIKAAASTAEDDPFCHGLPAAAYTTLLTYVIFYIRIIFAVIFVGSWIFLRPLLWFTSLLLQRFAEAEKGALAVFATALAGIVKIIQMLQL